MANEVNINIGSTTDLPQTLADVNQSVVRTERVVVSSMGTTEAAFDSAARQTGTLGASFDILSGASSQLAGGVGDLGGAFESFKEIQNLNANQASEQTRKLLDVEQAMQDTKQAAGDLEQAQLDLNQAQIDSKQAAADAEQAQLDNKQALLDAETAQKAYNDAVAEFGADSSEAKQASLDLAQAQQDLKQSNIDLEQANADAAQATADVGQAQRDMSQAAIDAKTSTQDLIDAQREAEPPTVWQDMGETMSTVAPIIMGVVGVIDLLALANAALTGTWIAQAAANVGSRIAMMASAAATGVMTAAQWALNAAMTANPIGLVIVAIGALVAAIVWIATQTTWFSDLWNWIWSKIGEPVKAGWEFIWGLIQWYVGLYVGAFNAIKDALITAFRTAIDWVVGAWNWLTDLPRKLGDAFRAIGEVIFSPFKSAFNSIANAWNNTVGRLSFTVPDWVPGMGGSGFSMPRIPLLQRGGEVIRDGAAMLHKGERVIPAATHGLWGNGMTTNGAPQTVIIKFEPEEFRKWFKKNTRTFGGTGDGNVQRAWGNV